MNPDLTTGILNLTEIYIGAARRAARIPDPQPADKAVLVGLQISLEELVQTLADRHLSQSEHPQSCLIVTKYGGLLFSAGPESACEMKLSGRPLEIEQAQ